MENDMEINKGINFERQKLYGASFTVGTLKSK